MVIGRAMRWRRKAVTNYCRLRGGKGIGRWWDEKIGRVEDAEFPEHIVFRCGKVRRVKDERGMAATIFQILIKIVLFVGCNI